MIWLQLGEPVTLPSGESRGDQAPHRELHLELLPLCPRARLPQTGRARTRRTAGGGRAPAGRRPPPSRASTLQRAGCPPGPRSLRNCREPHSGPACHLACPAGLRPTARSRKPRATGTRPWAASLPPPTASILCNSPCGPQSRTQGLPGGQAPWDCSHAPAPRAALLGSLEALENLAERGSLDSQSRHGGVRGARSPRGPSERKTRGCLRPAGAATPALASGHLG